MEAVDWSGFEDLNQSNNVDWSGFEDLSEESTPQEKPFWDKVADLIPTKKDLSEFVTDYTTFGNMAEPLVTTIGSTIKETGLAGPKIEESKINKARTLKALNENLEFEYKDLKDTWDAYVLGDKKSESKLREKRDKLNNEVVKLLDSQGLEAYYTNGKVKVVKKNNEGKDELIDIDDDILASIAAGMGAQSGEIVGGVGGALAGAASAQSFLPPTASPFTRGIAAGGGAALGGYTGSTLGSAFDLIRASIAMNKEIDAKELAEKSTARGVEDVTAAAIAYPIASVTKTGIKLSKKLSKLINEGNVDRALAIAKKDFDLTNESIEQAWNAHKKDVSGWEFLEGDDLKRAKIVTAIEQSPAPRSTSAMVEAVYQSPEAASAKSKEIAKRTKKVIEASNKFTYEPAELQKSIETYEKYVKDNYADVVDMYKDALPTYKYNLDVGAFSDTIDDISTRVIDPNVKEKLINLSNSLLQYPEGSIGDLLEMRKRVYRFYKKNKGAFDLKPDVDSLFGIQKAIDKKINEAIDTTGELSEPLKKAFADANKMYTDMFNVQDTATYKSVFKKATNDKAVGKNLIEYAKATDNDLGTVLNQLTPNQRRSAEFGVLQSVIEKYTKNLEAPVLDFKNLGTEIAEIRKSFKSKEANQFADILEDYQTKFAKDISISQAAEGVQPANIKNIATSVGGKAEMYVAGKWFSAIQRMIPSATGDRLSLVKALENAMEKANTPKDLLIETSKIKPLSDAIRRDLKKSVFELNKKQIKLQKEAEAEKARLVKEKLEQKAKKAQEARVSIDKAREEKKARVRNAVQEAKMKRTNAQAQRVKAAAEPKIGGSEEDAKEAVKKQFQSNDFDAQYKNMSEEDLKQFDELEKAGKPKGMSEDDWKQANELFETTPKYENGKPLEANEQKTISKVFKKMNLEDTENFDKYDKYETLTIFDKNGKVLSRYKGNKNSVVLPSEDRYMVRDFGKTATHNHPSAGSFSAEDLIFAIDHNLDEMRAVGHTKDATFYYKVKNLPIGKIKSMNRGKYTHGYRLLRDEYDNARDLDMSYFEPKALKNNRVKEKVISEAHTHKTMKRLAKKFGFEYERIRVKPKVNFQKWFKGSKVVDKEGKPLVVYHGRRLLKDNKEMDSFPKDAFFANKSKYAEQHAGKDTRYYPYRKNANGTKGQSEEYFMKNGRIYPVVLNIKNPKTITKTATQHNPEIEKQIIAKAKREGYDGLKIVYEGTDRVDYVAFSPEQIKSVNNRGTFSSSDKNILKSVGIGAVGAGAATQNKKEKE